MSRSVVLPILDPPKTDGAIVGGWWHDEEDRIVCDLCPRACSLKEGDRGFCFVRENRDGEMLLTTYGKSTGFCIDPIEKKPLNHFFPGTSVLSFGTAGCNLGCKFCQNWSISKSREVERLSEHATADMIAAAANRLGCKSVAFTYNDPVIWAEYAIDVAKACHEVDVKTVAVTAAYITEAARKPFFDVIDAANVDLKAFTEEFYQHLTLSHLQPVLDTMVWLKKETDVWFEVTNLVIPQANDGDDEFRRMCDWMLDEIGDDVPIHFTAFHPDFRLRDRERTPLETLLRAYEIARRAGLKYVYVGNVNDLTHQSTYCPSCHEVVIERDWYQLGRYQLDGNKCQKCGTLVNGYFEASPGDWGRKRQPVRISDFATRPASPGAANVLSSQTHVKDLMTQSSSKRTGTGDVSCPELNDAQRVAALRNASEVVLSAVTRRPLALSDPTIAGAADVPVFGCFVSIKRAGKLRGCCGFLGRRSTLAAAIQDSAKTSAVGDVRLPSVSKSELPFLDFEIWLLFGQEAIEAKGEDRIKQVEIGKHGLQIQRGQNRGLLLPGVATDHGLDAEGFLRQVCMKAGLPPTAWREDDTQLARFEGLVVTGQFDRSLLVDESPTVFLLTSDEVQALTRFCHANILATITGATPTYYLPGCSDGSVYGISLEAMTPGREEPLRIAQISPRQTFPLQSSLLQASQTIGQFFAREGGIGSQPLDVNLSILYEPAMHGTVENPDLGGFNVRERALLVSQGAKSAWLHDPEKTPEDLLTEAARLAQVTSPDRAVVTSYVVQANRTPVSVVNVPQPIAGPNIRPPAVAGMFYPGDPAELQRIVDESIPSDSVEKRRVRAAMIPHAGLRFSGRIAADVLRRIEIPSTVIVIGPKHTTIGVEWAVAPHDKWALPGIEIASDRDLARRLCDSIGELQMDALAHQREHAIEVELPFLARFAPDSKVVGIALSGGSLEQCLEFAEGLTFAIQESIDDTLLVISTDMNHFANDEETRRVDEIALKAIETLDPANVFNTVKENDISMCGVLPAVITMATLKKMGKLNQAERIGYATSADVTKDKSRVVGYAGMLFS